MYPFDHLSINQAQKPVLVDEETAIVATNDGIELEHGFKRKSSHHDLKHLPMNQ